ncbi:prephenate dehydratase domain-containing protein [uncultured Bifidobacterium sp.]|uniref:prephenate dehydratase n=1 Tax=uncultured Bifidobacterium sp. TaxID=165187 RepID=UPI0028DC1FC5|nr:prephenate dehydratase domain-containing protein [uncultured Bifidobacterium sp.]
MTPDGTRPVSASYAPDLRVPAVDADATGAASFRGSLPEALLYLGPRGSFTHQAAVRSASALSDLYGHEPRPTPVDDVPRIMDVVESGEAWGVIAWENNVEGYVVPNLDALIDARNVTGIARVAVDVAFDAFVLRDSVDVPLRQAVAHPHGLAQCRDFIARRGLVPVPAASNAAACRDLQPGQVALGPAVCGPLYSRRTLESGVQDFAGARTDFLVLAPRDDARVLLERQRASGIMDFESVVVFIPLSTGPGVLADLLDVLRDAGLNMTSFISRPIKGHDGTYSFIATVDAAPWQPGFHEVLGRLAAHGDWMKTLAVYARRERPNPPVDAWMLPAGGVGPAVPLSRDGDGAGESAESSCERELLW